MGRTLAPFEVAIANWKNLEMLEYAKVFTDFYGTSLDYVKQNLDLGLDILCCIDWQGAKQIKEKIEAVGIFLLPPSFAELERRLRSRSLKI